MLTVKVCAGTSCHLLGNPQIIEALENMPEFHNRIKVSFTSCFGKCEQGPSVMVGEQFITHASPEKVIAVIKEMLKSENK